MSNKITIKELREKLSTISDDTVVDLINDNFYDLVYPNSTFNKFKFVIGDWSHDGHNQHDEFTYMSETPLIDLQNAFKETVSREKCNSCDYEVDYWGKGANEVAQKTINRMHQKQRERQLEEDKKYWEEEQADYERINSDWGKIIMNNQALEEIQIVSDTRNLSGYDTGIEYRQKYLIDAFDLGNPVTIHISDEVFNISSSFIIGMFEPSTDYFKTMDDFFEHYRFDCNQTLLKCIIHGVQRIYFNGGI